MTTKKKTKGIKSKKSITPKAVKSVKSVKIDKVSKLKADDKRSYIEAPNFSTTPRDGEKSGAFIKRMLETNALTTLEIVAAVKENYPGSKCSGSDVGFYRLQLKKEGIATSVVREDKEGGRYILAA